MKCQGSCTMALSNIMMKTYVILWCLVCFVGFQPHSEAQTDLPHLEMLSGRNYIKNFFLKDNAFLFYLSSLKDGYTLEQRNETDLEETYWFPGHHRRYMRAYIFKENTIVKPVTSLNDFQGFVRVDTVEKAIEFARFRTSLQTYHLFRPHVMVEVFKRPPVWELEEPVPSGRCIPEFFEQHHLNNLEIAAKEGYFEIRRYLLAFPWEGDGVEEPILYKTVEKVYENGSYTREQETVLEGKIIYHNISHPRPPR